MNIQSTFSTWQSPFPAYSAFTTSASNQLEVLGKQLKFFTLQIFPGMQIEMQTTIAAEMLHSGIRNCNCVTYFIRISLKTTISNLFLFQVPPFADDLGREVHEQRDRRRLPRVQDRRRHDRLGAPQEHHGRQEGRRIDHPR